MFVRVKESCIPTAVQYRNCIVKLIDEKTGISVNGDIITLADYFGDKYYEKIADEEIPEDLSDQPCYKSAADYFKPGDWVKTANDQVYLVNGVVENSPMVRCRDVSQIYDTISIRWDYLTKLDPEDDDAVYGTDPISGDPIFNESSDDLITVYDFTRSGRVVEWGEILPMTIDTHSDEVERCYDCEEYYYTGGEYYYDYMHSDDGGDIHVCNDCYTSNDWMHCADCGNLLHADDSYEGDDGDWYCSSCIEDHRRSRLMHDYGYKPNPIFHATDSNTQTFLGVELEIDRGNDVDECLQDLDEYSDSQNLFYCKHDGSLDDGIEIVTHPCDIGFHLEKFPWAEVTAAAANNNFKSHDAKTCGLHIHVSRKGFGDTVDTQDLNIAKVIILVDRFWDELVNFSRRNYTQLDRWAKKPNARIYSYDDEETAKDKAKASSEYDRYKAVNLGNRNTVEFRLFRGSLQVETIKATIEFVQNLVDYVKSASLKEVQETQWTDITRFKEYPELNAYLEKRHLTEVPDKAKPDEPKPVERRFSPDDVVWFATSNTDNVPTRGTIQSVNTDYSVSQSPLYVVIGDDERVNFLVDEEILDNETIANKENEFQANRATMP